MDRFIVHNFVLQQLPLANLKSNMDRFIVKQFIAISNNILNLKSNMDRFIVIQQQKLTSIQCI